jgi:hypothetical protein
MYRPGATGEIVGEIMFYSGLGLSLIAGALYVGKIKKLYNGNAGRGSGPGGDR